MTTPSVPVSSTTFFNSALFNLNKANSDITLSVNRLSSGNRLTNAGDDVAALSVASLFKSQVVSLRQAKVNTAQSDSLLQVASGALTEIRDILDEMEALAVQSNSSSLTTTERGLLQTEFTALFDEIDRIAENTNFNSLNVLDGTISGLKRVSQTTTAATQGTATLSFTSNLVATETVILNGVTLEADNEFAVGGSIEATLDNLVTYLSTTGNDSRLDVATYERSGANLVITARAGGALSNHYVIDEDGATAKAKFSTSGGATAATDVFTLDGGVNDGVYQGGIIATGSVSDTIIDTQDQSAASVTLSITGAISDGDTISFDDGDASTLDFTFKNTASTSIQVDIGADDAETLRNLVSKLEQYTGDDDYVLKQLEFRRNGSTLIITNKQGGDATDLGVSAATIAESSAGLSLSSGTIDDGENSGVNVNGVTNSSFVGTISGFSATYNSADNITASLTVGGIAYSSTIADTTPATDTVVRFTSATGGYFDIELNGGAGLTVADSSDASTYASRLDAAFAGLTFYQSRAISNFTGVNDLVGASAEIRLDNFSNVNIEDIRVTAAPDASSDAIIEFDIKANGTTETYRSTTGIGDTVGAYETLELTSLTDSSKRLRIYNATSDIALDTATNATTFRTTLRTSFGLTGTASGIDTQVGSNSADVINISIGDARTGNIFAGATPDISSQSNAATAQTLIGEAQDTVSEIIANIGALQARLNYASSNLDNQILHIDSARSNLEDTDVAYESTELSTSILRSNVAAAVIAQATGLQSSLLDLVRAGV